MENGPQGHRSAWRGIGRCALGVLRSNPERRILKATGVQRRSPALAGFEVAIPIEHVKSNASHRTLRE
jgi:hypothetical protein